MRNLRPRRQCIYSENAASAMLSPVSCFVLIEDGTFLMTGCVPTVRSGLLWSNRPDMDYAGYDSALACSLQIDASQCHGRRKKVPTPVLAGRWGLGCGVGLNTMPG